MAVWKIRAKGTSSEEIGLLSRIHAFSISVLIGCCGSHLSTFRNPLKSNYACP